MGETNLAIMGKKCAELHTKVPDYRMVKGAAVLYDRFMRQV